MASEEQTNVSSGLVSIRDGKDIRAAQRLTISGRIVSALSFYLAKSVGSPTGNVTFTIRKVSDDSVIVSKVWGNASALGAAAWKQAVFDTPAEVNEEVRICVEFSGGSFNNEILAYGVTSDVKSGEYETAYKTSWVPQLTWDLGYIYTYEEEAGLENKSANMGAKMVAGNLI